ncbi:MAG TPA: hypothetical protein VGF36_15165 [Rhodopila sp.]|jgi:hypothetical protein
MNFWRRRLILGLATAFLAGCTQSNRPPDTPLAHLSADVAAMKNFPTARITARCGAALQELASTVNDINKMDQRGKPVDAISRDVLENDQVEAEKACHPEAVRLCQAPTTPEATRACSRVVGMSLYPERAGG